MRVCEWDGPVLKHLAGEQVGCQWCGPHHERDAINPYHPQYYHSPRRRLCLPTHQHMLGSLPLAVDPAIGPPGTPTHLMHLPTATIRGRLSGWNNLHNSGCATCKPAPALRPGRCYVISASSCSPPPHPSPWPGSRPAPAEWTPAAAPPSPAEVFKVGAGEGGGPVT